MSSSRGPPSGDPAARPSRAEKPKIHFLLFAGAGRGRAGSGVEGGHDAPRRTSGLHRALLLEAVHASVDRVPPAPEPCSGKTRSIG
jgi:hypothetical protein